MASDSHEQTDSHHSIGLGAIGRAAAAWFSTGRDLQLVGAVDRIRNWPVRIGEVLGLGHKLDVVVSDNR